MYVCTYILFIFLLSMLLGMILIFVRDSTLMFSHSYTLLQWLNEKLLIAIKKKKEKQRREEVIPFTVGPCRMVGFQC